MSPESESCQAIEPAEGQIRRLFVANSGYSQHVEKKGRITPAMRYLVALLFMCASGVCQDFIPACKVTFSVVRQDSAGAMISGFRPELKQWFEKKMAKKYPEVCYSDGDSDVVLFFSATPAIYHGVRTYTTSDTTTSPVTGTVTGTSGERVGTIDGEVRTTTDTTHHVAYEVDYSKLYMAIQVRMPSGAYKAVESFDGRTLHPTYFGFCTGNCHPSQHIIEDAVKWLRASGYDNSKEPIIH